MNEALNNLLTRRSCRAYEQRQIQAEELVNSLCRGNGRTGSLSGFTTLNEEDCANIYRLMV